MRTLKLKTQFDEKGFASLVIAIVLILVLSLMTIGFAELMRHEERSALDKHLASQAYYAAEAGINDALKAISTNPNLAKTNCGPDPLTPAISNNQVGDPSVSYPCLTIDPTPNELDYKPVETSQAKIVELNGVYSNGTTATIDHVVIGWQYVDSAKTDFVNPADVPAHAFKKTLDADPTKVWNAVPVLRIGLTPIAPGADRATLINSTASAFLYPLAAGSPTVPTGDDYSGLTDINAGNIIDGKCDAGNPSNNANLSPKYCNVMIKNLPGQPLLLYMRSVYGASDVSIRAFDSGGTLLELKNAQTVIDSTGKAQDVLKRLQVRVPPALPDVPAFTLETGGNICKQLQLVAPPDISGHGCTP